MFATLFRGQGGQLKAAVHSNIRDNNKTTYPVAPLQASGVHLGALLKMLVGERSAYQRVRSA